MGVNLKDLIPNEAKKTLELVELRGKIVTIDAYNALYQFLTAIRGEDGKPLMDSKGRITSHLSGLFYRTISIMEHGIKPIYVFDGQPPEIKAREIERRRLLKIEAERKYEEALSRGDLEAARLYAMQSSKLTDEMVQRSKVLLDAMGVPWVQAPAEGEAQAAYIASKGDAWATGSQDYDSILFGAPRLIRNLTITGRRKLPRKEVYIEIKPELIDSTVLLKTLGLTREQLIDIAILLGTDYNPEGVKGIGAKTALKLVKTYGSLERVLPTLKAQFPVDPMKIKEYFMNPPVTDDYTIEWKEPDKDRIVEILVGEFDFSEKRVLNAYERLIKAYREHFKAKQLGLEAWFSS